MFAAFASVEAKGRWFVGPGEGTSGTRPRLSRRRDGALASGSPDGARFTFDAEYQDIVPDAAIVYIYEMTVDGNRLSASVATIDFRPGGGGTRLGVTEQGVYLDGLDTAASASTARAS